MNQHAITEQFEKALCEYTGARYAVAVNSCTMALLLALELHILDRKLVLRSTSQYGHRVFITVPKRTYVSVPQSVIHAGGQVLFRDEDWSGSYRLEPFPVYDCARRFTGGMYERGTFQCVSFHTTKILGDTQGGAILHDHPEADAWLRRARFDGRTPGVPPNEDTFTQIGWHCYMSPDVAARLLCKLCTLPYDNADLPNDDYPDLSQFEVFTR